MFAVIDCGTTFTRIFIVDDRQRIVASGDKKVGVRDTSITGSRDKLRNGVAELFFDVLSQNNIPSDAVEYAIASGMITSEVGLIEIPHLVAPIGKNELSEGILEVEDQSVLPLGRPIYFIRGVRNNYAKNARVQNLHEIDFMRGEEVQCVGILQDSSVQVPCNIVALSSHTKVMYIDEQSRIAACNTTISGQFYEALVNSTNIGKSIVHTDDEEAGGYSREEIIEIAADCVKRSGLGRTMLMPRFMQVLLKTNSDERNLFVNAAIAADDLLAFEEIRDRGYKSDRYILYGHRSRCELYEEMLKDHFGPQLQIRLIYERDEISELTVRGVIAIALKKINH